LRSLDVVMTLLGDAEGDFERGFLGEGGETDLEVSRFLDFERAGDFEGDGVFRLGEAEGDRSRDLDRDLVCLRREGGDRL